jgi:hypothetical protein
LNLCNLAFILCSVKSYLTTKTIFAAILAVGMFALSQMPSSNSAMADRNNNYNDHQIPSTVTIPLEGLRLKAGQFIELSDTDPLRVAAAHVTINVPCQNDNNNKGPESDIAVVAGVAPELKQTELEFIAGLSNPEDNCTYHADILGNENDEVTDIAIINPGHVTVEFKSGNFATISITEVNG